jgi:hypothetical protein
MDWSFRESWNEFAWGREISKDELRISGYFRVLPRNLDLPGEEELIFNELMSEDELIPTGVDDPMQVFREDMESGNDQEFEEERREVRRKCAFPLVRQVEKQAGEWNVCMAEYLKPEQFYLGLPVTCAFGKLISRIYNFEENESGEGDTLSLRIGLLKRMLADLNELVNMLIKFKEHSLIPEVRIEIFNAYAANFREEILNKLNSLRQ